MTTGARTTGTVRSADGATIAYERIGTGPAVILVDAPGHVPGTDLMRDIAERIREDLTVYCYDRRGRGASTEVPPYSVDREVEDLHALIQAAGGTAAVHGFSAGAVLAMHAAAAGLAIPRLVLLEPPLDLRRTPSAEAGTNLAAEIAELIAGGRRGDAYEHFLRAIELPPEFIARTRRSPVWPELEALAHTLIYDLAITSTMTADHVRAIRTPTLVVNSAATDERLLSRGRATAAALPNATHRTLPGEWHDVSAADLAPALIEHVTGNSAATE